jgi:Predicted peptidase
MRIISCILFSIFCYGIQGQTDFKPMVHKSGLKSLNYQILEPPGFDEGKKYPLFIFLHGAGERGSDNKKQLVHGSQLFRDSISKYPAVVIFPQCPKDDYWAKLSRPDKGGRDRHFEFESSGEPRPSLGMVIELITEMKSKPYIDTDRIYISGLSMGGFWCFLN